MKQKLFALSLLAASAGLSSCKKESVDPPVVPVSAPGIDTRGLDYYIKIAETLATQQEPPQADWDSLFVTPYYDLLLNTFRASTPEAEKNVLRLIYKQGNLTPQQQQQYAHQLNYKSSLPQLKAYSASVKDGSIRTLLKPYLYPVLPPRLQNDALVPRIVYTYYFSEEANGLEDKILQDALLAYKVDGYAKGILTAHEAFHSVATGALIKRYKLQLPASDARYILALTLTGIAQEGIADLIDKETLGRPGSPVQALVQGLMVDEVPNSVRYIRALDDELVRLSTQPVIANPQQFRQLVSGFAGHQPGRYMGLAIKQAGLLNEAVADVENPFQFVYTYNKVATRSNGTYPALSAAAITYLKKVEDELLRPL